MIPLNTQLKTRNGSQAFVFQTFQDSDRTTNYFGAYLTEVGYWAPAKWRADGKFYGNVIHGEHGNDLMLPKRSIWVLWGDPTYTFYTEEQARRVMREYPFHTLQEVTES